MNSLISKLTLAGGRTQVTGSDAKHVLVAIFTKLGFASRASEQVAAHLVDTSLCGIESHGIMRVLEYAKQVRTGYLDPTGMPSVQRDDRGVLRVEGGGGIGIPTMQLAYETGVEEARGKGISALSVRHVGHTGRHGAFADIAAEHGFLTICVGGGNRKTWRQVAPYGGARGLLPTNPWCVGIPGGDQGPVVLDFATSMIAGGWIYAAQSAGALLPEGCVIDRDGNPTRDPGDYFDGGAILPSGAHKGYALAVVGEIIGEAMLGPSTTECNWLLITLDATRFREPGAISASAEEVLAELRQCPPAPGFTRVEVPGERERNHRAASEDRIAIPDGTWAQIRKLAHDLGVMHVPALWPD
jgi:LDH2 family malate/lactate/ureidoglycolate dehydrogenase